MDREKVIKALHDARRYLEDKEWSDRGASPHIDSIIDAIALLKEGTVVRCKDCADGHLLTLPDGKKVIECREYLCHELDWFCADGVKKT